MATAGERQPGGLVPRWHGWDNPAEQRIAELGSILALGLVRLQARMSSKNSALIGESSLDFGRLQSGDRDRSPKSEGRHG